MNAIEVIRDPDDKRLHALGVRNWSTWTTKCVGVTAEL